MKARYLQAATPNEVWACLATLQAKPESVDELGR